MSHVRSPAAALRLALVVALLLLPASGGGAVEDPVFARVKAERNEADRVWSGGSPFVAREAFVQLAGELDGDVDEERLWLRASIEARLGTLSDQIGELEEAEAWWNLAIDDYQDCNHFVSAASILANLAVLQSDTGRTDLALDWITEAIELHEALGRRDRAAFDLYLRAVMHFEVGDMGPGLRDVVDALELFVADGDIDPGGKDRAWYLYCRGFIAAFVLELGEPRIAAEELSRILADDAMADASLSAKWRAIEAAAWSDAGENELAGRALLEAQTQVDALAIDSLGATMLRTEAHLALGVGDADTGCTLLESSWGLAESMGQFHEQISSGALWAECLNDLGRHKQALLVAQKVQLLADTGQSLEAWEAWYQAGRAHEGLGHYDEAADSFAEAVELASVRLDELSLDAVAMGRWRFDLDHVFDSAAAARLAVARNSEDVETALDLLEQNRSRLLLTAVLGGSTGQPTAAPSADRPLDAALPGPTRRALGRVRRLPSLQGRPWLERLRLRAPGGGLTADAHTNRRERHDRALGAATVSVATLRERLPRNMGVVVFRTAENATDLFWVERGRVETHRLAVDEALLRGLIDRHALAMTRSVSSPDRRPALDEAAADLRAALLGPVEERLRGVRQVVIVPDGDLYRVPFAALRRGGRYLVEEVTVSVAPSLNILDALLDREHDTLHTFVGIADPRNDLPRARLEVTEAAELFGSQRVLAGTEADLASVLSAAKGADVLHFATHGELESTGRPSWLALAAHDALDAESILDLDLNIPLVTLSACRSARGGQSAGESLVNSLARSFLAAGAESVVGSLWDVHDGSTHELMSRFYESLAAGGFVADSLADAQRGMALSGEEFEHPWYWAGFVVVGDPR